MVLASVPDAVSFYEGLGGVAGPIEGWRVKPELTSVGDPPALPGRPPQFDISGSHPVNSPREPAKAHDEEFTWMTSRA